MRKFLQKALEKLDKMNPEQIGSLIADISSENDLLEMVLDSMTDGLVVCDRENRVLRFNKSYGRLVPLVEGDIADRFVWSTTTDMEIASFFEEKLESQERVMDVEFTLTNGVPRTLSCSIMPLVKDGRVQGSLVHIEDVTEKRSKEARLRRAESLAALTTLAAGVAHEIKNPLGSIGIHLQLTQKEMAGKKTVAVEKVSRYLEVIQEEVDRLNRIVVDFLFTVRPMDTNLEIRDINQVVQEVLDFVRFELEEASVTLSVRLARNIPSVRLDERYLKQALLNLINNAVSAMPGGGELEIQTMQKGEEVLLTVRDTGVGITEEHIEKIFEPYFTTKDFGTGLGLTLVFKIIKEHLGEISVSSREGHGTSFILSFPLPQYEKRRLNYQGEAV